ncbi:GGDEF domain-containing protein [Chelativorans sp. M5D2P16]|uniref:GGDEF domain-containing protein n=1 Tax=Chelativorans sp. M5D2P16 TaxID=3095678 RepID=UPI002ACA3410|nr:GGDEF domain-containing protein [Chelativorans sp. M5D2P16]MDZ5696965.1 GGDEF domain-containing protein [Chelativorans sp. M5D2P16]
MLQTADASQGKIDIATAIAASMRRMGVVGLPRNYELFYEVSTGANAEICDAFNALGNRPTQAALDQLSRRYFTHSSRHLVIENAWEQIALRADEILALLGRERSSLEKFGLILGQTRDGLDAREILPGELLRKIVGILAAATETTLEHGRRISEAMEEKSAELCEVKAKLEKYKHLAETDPLTKVWNRGAFDQKLAAIYANDRAVLFHALLLVDIDGFKAFNDSHGHPAEDRILQMVARGIEAACAEGSFVARTGGEEFAAVVEGLSEEAAEAVAERIRVSIAEAEFVVGPSSTSVGPVNVSLGLCMAAQAPDAEALYARADRALYASKAGGRNRVTRFSKLGPDSLSKRWLLYRGA